MNDVIIRADHLKKTYRQYKSNMQKIQNLVLMKDVGETTEVLNDVSFEIRRGEKVGIIGRQMSGKSTLMKLLAGVIVPDSGSVSVEGRLTPVLDNKLGFESTMSGRDNYIMRCKLYDWPDETAEERMESVFEFAELSDVIDEPMKSYRAGSAARLGFTIATELKPEIFFYDEGFAFGGKKYIGRFVRRLAELTEGEDVTFVMTINSTKIGAKLCTRGIVLYQGTIVFDGPYDEAVEYFKENCRTVTSKPKTEEDEEAAAQDMDPDSDGEEENDGEGDDYQP